tara:strand:- start:1689 stop:2117 length:429 start_codon:yes stop_codon:yes gene_type:complete
MEQKQETDTETKHEERTTEVYSIADALHELEVDLRYNANFPRDWNDERTDRIRIHTGFMSPSLVISKAQCKRWISNHFNESRTSKVGKHWEKEGQLYVSISRSRYNLWVSCGENRFRTEESAAGLQAGEDARDAIFNNMGDD